ncbi:MAG: cyclopropane-fatty-acyl-phospholipid synthase family protein [Terriglobales bacterium]
MAELASRPGDRSAAKTLKFVQYLLRDVHPRNFTVELWDGSAGAPEKNQFHHFTWKINSPDVPVAIVHSSNRQVALGEAYVRGDFDIVGDIESAFPLADYLINKEWSLAEKVHLASLVFDLPALKRNDDGNIAVRLSGKPHSKQRDGEAVRYHYDISNQFYALWLDRNMLYSCAHFDDPAEDLDTAQEQKMNDICIKLRLKPGERLIDIGCGWGGLIIHAAREYGVHATGITLSQGQADLARKRIRTAGLSDRCEVRRLDYRDLDELGVCDKLGSVGMVEHVGESKLRDYFRCAFRVLRPGGMFLNSGITRAGNRAPSNEPTFTDVYVFPDGELVTIATILANAEEAGFEVRALENLREHYYQTTINWLHRLEARAAEARQIVGDARYRTWHLYLAGSAYYFQKAWLGLCQTLLIKNENCKWERTK